MKKKISCVGIFLLILMIGLSPLEAKKKKLKVVASLPSLASITEIIGGDYVEVSSITRGAQDAHYIEAKPSYMVNLSRADLLIYSGLELEIGWLPLLIQGARNNKVAVGSRGNLNASNALSSEDFLERPRGEVDRTMGDVHPLGNPHYLVNPRHGLKVARLIAQKLIELDSEHKDEYEANLKAFEEELEKRIAEWESRAAPLKGMEVVCYHPHWSYALDWLGIKPAGYIELRPGIPPPPKHKRAIEQLIKDRDIKLVIISSWKEPTKARQVAKATGSNLVILPGEVRAAPEAEDYFAWFDYIITELVKAAPAAEQETGDD